MNRDLNLKSSSQYDVLLVGGHHTSAIPLIKLFKKDGYSIKFIGHKYASKSNRYLSNEYKEIKSLEVEYTNLYAAKFYNVTGLKKYIELIISIFFCLGFLLRRRPRLIISFGGYLAVPVVIAGRVLGIYCVTHEQTVVSGLANRVIERFVNKIYLTWDTSSKHYKKRTEVVGLPLRSEVIKIGEKRKKRKLELRTIFIQGGKQGSHLINQFLFKNIDYMTNRFTVYHQTGKHSANSDHLIAKRLAKKYKKYHPFVFLRGSKYVNIFKDADLILTRAGAHITYELSYLKIPAIFVPISWSSNNEQYENAQISRDYTPSVILEEKNISLKSFERCVNDLKNQIRTRRIFKEVINDASERMYLSIKQLLNNL